MAGIHALDVGMILLYFVAVLVIGMYVSKTIRNFEDLSVAGRRFGTFSAAVGAASNIAGGASTVGTAADGFRLGLSGGWFGIATALQGPATAWFMGIVKKVADKHRFVTVGDFLGYRYSKAAKVIAGAVNGISYAGFVAGQAVTLGAVLSAVLGWNLKVSIAVGSLVCIGYTVAGGLPAAVYTDYLQLTIIWLGVAIIGLRMALGMVGGFGALVSRLPAQFLDIGRVGVGSVLGTLISTALASFVLQASYAYAISTRNSAMAVKARYITSVLYIVPTLSALLIGMCGLIYFGKLANPSQVLPKMILEIFPPGVAGLVLAAVPAATMSTFDTCITCSVSSFVQDVYKPLINPNASGKELLVVSRVLLVVVGLAAMVVAMIFPRIIPLILWGYAFGVGALLAPNFAAFFWPRATKEGALAAMVVGGATQLGLTIWKVLPSTIPPVLVSLPVSAIVLFVVSLATPAPDPKVVEGMRWN